MVTLGILFLFGVVLPAFGILPISRGGRVAWNNAVMVKLPPDEVTIEQGQSPRGRKAQEVADFAHRWLGALVIALPVGLLTEGTVGAFATFMAAAVATLWVKALPAHFDLVGHGVEIIVAGGDEYRAAEVNRMRLHSPAFQGWTNERIDAALRKREWLSRIFAKVCG